MLNDHFLVWNTKILFQKKIKFNEQNFCKSAHEHLAELMPIFERLRAQEQIPCAYPLHMTAGGTAFIRGSKSTPLSPHAPHCHPSTHWVSFLIIFFFISNNLIF